MNYWVISWGLFQAPLYPLKLDVSQELPGLSGVQASSGPHVTRSLIIVFQTA